ncbi:hypothetical protein V8B97DRAFT_2008657 [Scleroderma yunnanense]
MSSLARRQPSTTSLAKFARSPSTGPDDYVTANGARSLDFCNAFWGLGDGGVDVLFARMRGAGRTMEELKNFWKERATIEEEYAKRLTKLAKMPIGKDEIGELRNSIDTLRLETDKQAGSHIQLAQQIHSDLEGQVAVFAAKQQQHKKVYQAAIEKEYRVKQTREQHAAKAREKYESDCVRINSYTAQSTLVQGKDLEKIHLKLERAQQTVQVNENDYAQFTRVLQETMQNWEQDWKAFCDSCQDLEEERMEFMKDNMWAYANAVSTVCVSDDESCEKMRLALEQMEPDKEMENFVRDYSTGNAIPEPPAFINYANTDAPPVNPNRILTRPALFARTSQRPPKLNATSPQEEEPPYDITGPANHAGVGAGGGPPTEGSTVSRSATYRSQSGRSQVNGVNGHVTSPSRDGQPVPVQTQSPPIPTQAQTTAAQRRNSTASMLMRTPSQAPSHGHSFSMSQAHSQSQGPGYGPDPVDPSVSSTQLVIGQRAWDVNPLKDPQPQQSRPGVSASASQPTSSRTSPPVGVGEDPLVKQMAELSTAAAASGTTGRRNTIVRRDVPPISLTPGTSSRTSPPGPGFVGGSGKGETLTTPAAGPSSTRDFRNSAEVVVGGYPLAQSRPTSPNPVPPRPALVAPPPRAGSSSSPSVSAPIPPAASNIPVEQIVENYQRPFPGEPGRSRANSTVGQPPPNLPPSSSSSAVMFSGPGQGLSQSPVQQQDPGTRPTSRAGYPGIGTTSLIGRAPSPVRSTSASAGAIQPYNRAGPVVAAGAAAVGAGNQHLVRGGSVSYPHMQQQQQQQRPVTPSNPVGIALGPDGRVVHDQMAVQHHPHHRPTHSASGSIQLQRYPSGPGPASTNQQIYGGGAGAGGYGDGRMGQVPPPAPSPGRNDYYGAVVPSSAQGPGAYGHPTHYDPHPSQYGAPPHSQPQQQQQAPPPLSSYGGNGVYGPPVRHPSVSGGGAGAYGGGQYQQQPQGYQQQQQQMRYYSGGGTGGNNGSSGAVFRAPSPAVARSPSPQPPRAQHPPTCSYTDDGRPILFYGASYSFLYRLSDAEGWYAFHVTVKALYDYTATIDEEFDFQAGDIIAVTETPEDGWWSGELLDEARKQPGRHVFPSNFVCLF